MIFHAPLYNRALKVDLISFVFSEAVDTYFYRSFLIRILENYRIEIIEIRREEKGKKGGGKRLQIIGEWRFHD